MFKIYIDKNLKKNKFELHLFITGANELQAIWDQ